MPPGTEIQNNRTAASAARVYADMRMDDLPVFRAGSILVLTLPLLMGAAPQMTPTPRPIPPVAAGVAIPMPPDRAEDSYAIYSLLMPGEEFTRMAPEQTAQWAISEITVNANDRNPAIPPQGQLKPPPDNPRGFEEALQDYETNQYVRVQLTREPFRLAHPFTLVAPGDVSALRAAKSAPATGEMQSRWAGYPGVTFFSEVYFDTRHQAALVYMNDWCAHLCASGSWFYLEKHGGQWVRRSGIVVPGI